MAMALFALGKHLPPSRTERGKKRHGVMTDIVVGDPFNVGEAHREHGLGALECLHLAFLIGAEHQRVLRRIQIRPHDAAHLLDENESLESLK